MTNLQVKELRCEIAVLLRKHGTSLPTPRIWEWEWDPGNYGLVSLMPAPRKLVGSIVKDKIANHKEKALLKQNQHGFCKGRSFPIKLLELFESVRKHIDRGDLGDILYLDFENVSTKYLTKEVSLEVLLWISNWLSNRKQRVGINGQSLEWREAESQVCQGLVLGPVLLNLLINYLELGVR